jgi:hypothetical protein
MVQNEKKHAGEGWAVVQWFQKKHILYFIGKVENANMHTYSAKLESAAWAKHEPQY